MSKVCICDRTRKDSAENRALLEHVSPYWILKGFTPGGRYTEVIIPRAEFCPWCGGSLKGGAENE